MTPSSNIMPWLWSNRRRAVYFMLKTKTVFDPQRLV